MRISTKLVVALVEINLLLFGGVQAFAQEWSAEQKEVLKMEKTYWDLLKAGGFKRVFGIMA